jgi:tetratricopeptide (TPR) repeat protein
MKLKLPQFILVIFALQIVAGCNHQQNIQDWTEQASKAMEDENYERAAKCYSEAIKLDSKFAPAYAARGDVFVILGQFDKAIEDLNEAILLNPTNYAAHVLRGAAYFGKQQFDKAISDYNVALENELDDKNALKTLRGEAYKMRGQSYYWTASFTNAIADLTEALKYRPDDYEIYEVRGDCYDRRTDADKSLSDFSHAILLNPEDARAFYGRGTIYSHTGSYTNAILDFEIYIKLKPKSPGAYNMLGWMLATCPDDKIRDGKRAVELATKACDLSKWEKYAYMDTLAAAYAEIGDYENAVKYQKQAISLEGVPESNRTNVQNRVELYLEHKPYRETNIRYHLTGNSVP